MNISPIFGAIPFEPERNEVFSLLWRKILQKKSLAKNGENQKITAKIFNFHSFKHSWICMSHCVRAKVNIYKSLRWPWNANNDC